MKEALERGKPGTADIHHDDPFWDRTLEKPVIGAINGFAMGGGFMLVERTDLRVAVKEAVFEISEAKRWLLGGYDHGFVANLPHPVATEMALGFRFTAERLHQVGFINRLVAPEQLMPEAMGMAEHLLSLPPASRVNTIYMMRHMMPRVDPSLERLAGALHAHGCAEDRMESRRAFAEKRKPVYRGWDDPGDRYRMPTLEGAAGET
jgi:enoyl-CoA hydratase/carnithine racemase